MHPPHPTRTTRALINTAALEANYRLLASLAAPHAGLIAVVKADAYGHGCEICVPALLHAGAESFAVVTLEEALAVRALAPSAHILVLGGIFDGQIAAALAQNLTPVVWDLWQLKLLEEAARAQNLPAASIPVHIELDTGMSRQGVSPADLEQFLRTLSSVSVLRVEGIMTHLYAADETNSIATEAQLNLLDRMLAAITRAGIQPEILHAGSSAAIITEIAPRIHTLAARHKMRAALRPGLSLYGIVPEFSPAHLEPPQTLLTAREQLKPVLSWETRVTTLREIPAGAVVGYNGTFVATEPMTLALLPVGYADGLTRSLGNRFSLLVRGQRAPIVGRISMDLTTIDVTEIPGVAVGDEVILIGRQGGEEITAADHARVDGTISWEILTRISGRVPRMAVESK